MKLCLLLSLIFLLASCNGIESGVDPIVLGSDQTNNGGPEDETVPVSRIENFPPTITNIPTQLLEEDESIVNLEFNIDDDRTRLDCASSVSVIVYDSSVIDESSVVLSGIAPNCKISLSPLPNANGITYIGLILDDGENSASDSFAVIIDSDNDEPTLSDFEDLTIDVDTSSDAIEFTIEDIETNVSCNSSVAVLSSNRTLLRRSGILVEGDAPDCTLTLTPAAGMFGTTNVTVSLTDGSQIKSKTFELTVTAINDAPEISSIVNQTTNVNFTHGPIPFTVTDIDSTVSCLTSISLSSSESSVIEESSITVSGTAPNCFLTMKPTGPGISTITITVDDGDLSAETSFDLDSRVIRFTKLLGVAPDSTTIAMSLAQDAQYNTYVVGGTNGNLDGQSKTGTSDMFLTKYDSNINRKWTKLLGSPSSTVFPNRLTLDSSGNIYIIGDTSGDLNGEEKQGVLNDAFIAKYDSEGELLWTKLIGDSSGSTQGKDIFIDTDDSVYVTGQTTGSLNGIAEIGVTDAFLAKFDSEGEMDWIKTIGVTGEDTYSLSIAVDSDHAVYITGSTTGNLNGETLNGNKDGFISRFNSSGVHAWTQLTGASGKTVEFYGLVIDASDKIYISGLTTGSIDGEVINGSTDACLIKYDTMGNKVWTRLAGSIGKYSSGLALGVDGSSNIYITGTTTGDFAGGDAAGIFDGFVLKYDLDGDQLWARTMGESGGLVFGTDIYVDATGNTVISGSSSSALNGVSSIGFSDGFFSSLFSY
jgi:hypothetical protein